MAKVKEKKPLLLWKGAFNYSRAILTVYSYATTEKGAKTKMINQIAKKHEVHPSHVFALFDGSKPNFKIEIDKVWRRTHEHQLPNKTETMRTDSQG